MSAWLIRQEAKAICQAAHARRLLHDAIAQREQADARRRWINCDPLVGSELRKVRTCVVVSNDLANQYGATVTVIPTLRYSRDRAALPFMVDLRWPRSTMDTDRVANASMVMTYDRSRVASGAGRVAPDTLKAIGRALAVHLGLALPW